MDNAAWWLWLQHALGAGASRQRQILENYRNIEAFYEAGPAGWRLLGCLTPKEVQRLGSFTPEQAQALADSARALGEQILTPDDAAYPQLLRDLPNYPCALFLQGTLPPVDFLLSVAVVGTRHATQTGLGIAHAFGYDLASAGAVVVSGGAMGIDAEAHRGAIESGGMTVCVLGCGLDVPYLLQNAALREAAARNGALLSEYPPGARPTRISFPIRNRIISALCDATVVVEADERSGSLITARDAMKQGRAVFAVPGSERNPCSRGTNALLRDGCSPAMCALDVLCTFEEKYKLHLQQAPDKAARKRCAPKTVLPARQAATPPAPPAPVKQEAVPSASLAASLSKEAAALFAVLDEEPQELDALCTRCALPVPAVLAAATELELQGLAQGCAGQRYRRAP